MSTPKPNATAAEKAAVAKMHETRNNLVYANENVAGEQAAMANSRATAKTIQKPNIEAEQLAAQRAQREEQKAKADAAIAAAQREKAERTERPKTVVAGPYMPTATIGTPSASTRGRGSFGSTPSRPPTPAVQPKPPSRPPTPSVQPKPPPRTTTPAVQPKPQPKIIVDPVRPMPVTGVKPMTGGMSQPPRPTPPPMPYGMKKGGSINLAGCKVNTAKKNTKSRF